MISFNLYKTVCKIVCFSLLSLLCSLILHPRCCRMTTVAFNLPLTSGVVFRNSPRVSLEWRSARDWSAWGSAAVGTSAGGGRVAAACLSHSLLSLCGRVLSSPLTSTKVAPVEWKAAVVELSVAPVLSSSPIWFSEEKNLQSPSLLSIISPRLGSL